MSTLSESYVSRILFAPPPLDRLINVTACRWAPAHSLTVPSISARAALHAWPRPKMAREACGRRELIECELKIVAKPLTGANL
jgi:hypothetical protein